MKLLCLVLLIALTAGATGHAEVLLEWRADQRFQHTLQGDRTDELTAFVEDVFGPYSLGLPFLNEIRIQQAIMAPNHVMVFWKFDDLAGYAEMASDPYFNEIASLADTFHEDVSLHLWRSAPWAPETLYGEPDLKGLDEVTFFIRAKIFSDYSMEGPYGPRMVARCQEIVNEWATLPGVVSVSSYYVLAADWQVLFDVRFADMDSWLEFHQNEAVQSAQLDLREFFTQIQTELWGPHWYTPESLFPRDHQ